MTARLDGKIIIVTGAASGIGAATAKLIAARGGTAVATDIQSGVDHVHDVTDPAQWDTVIAATVARHGRIDGLVSNAGTAGACPIIDLDLEDFRHLTRIHVEGAFVGIQKVVAQLRLQSTPAAGSIVVTSSVMAQQAFAGVVAYCAAKAALSSMARAIGVELGRKGDLIRINPVAPGPTQTPLLVNATSDGHFDDPASWGDIPMGGFQQPEDIAEAIVFLLSDDSSFMTSSTLTVDGGWSLT
jgi:NAD(P)-dependent dehydrogenase (short-subunit alcohol dehydrogenase family)